jgi:hypothetical protein
MHPPPAPTDPIPGRPPNDPERQPQARSAYRADLQGVLAERRESTETRIELPGGIMSNLNAGSWTGLRVALADFFGSTTDAIDWVLPDLTLIGPRAGDELRRMVYGS